ncbi:MAG: Clp protease ClpP [Synergistaceae bacterium]|nr:Clp protease ClpP [Synergistaceae bacterium]
MYKILNSAEGTEILLYSLIEGGLTAGKLIKSLQASQSDSITLRINSDGGEVFDAIAIYNYLKDKNVHVVIDGICASAASIVAMSGKHITMKQGSMMMIHNPLTFAIGESEDLRAQADILDKITEAIVSIYMSRTGKPHDEITALMDAESWMDGPEAVGLGFADEYQNVPETLPAQIPPANDILTYDDGVKAERERIKALDELYTPGRARVINEAKYSTGKTAQEIAIDILKAEARITPKNGVSLPEINNFPARGQTAEIDAFIDAVNRKKGR